MTDSYIPNSTNWTEESCHFGNPVSISSYQPKLDQHQPLDILISYPFPEIELELESDPEAHAGDSISLYDSIMTPVSLPDFFLYSGINIEAVPVHRELNHQYLMITLY